MSDDDYRKAAEQCMHMAERATRLEDRESWLGLAQRWLGLIPPDRQGRPFESVQGSEH